jgi:hydrogenase maturation protein HypF
MAAVRTGYEISVRGLVQGVGFRPFICRLAFSHDLSGEVINRTDGVTVIIKCDRKAAERFVSDIRTQAPPAAIIKSIAIKRKMVAGYSTFSITASKDTDASITEVSPDIAVCSECLTDLDSDPERIDYPFVNCTNCGPRFTIIKALPYDRDNTTMEPFSMCLRCASEYHDILDRRFHAQPVACNRCGPEYFMHEDGHRISGINQILKVIADRLNTGRSVAIKSLGGYNLMCDALNEETVKTLRQRKQRDRKPFAVMFRDISAVKEYCIVGKEEEAALTSWRRPILILKQLKTLAPSASSGLNTTGAMLPYMPLHYMLFRVIDTPALIMTSGNLSDEPIITDDRHALQDLMPVTGIVVSYNREINNRVDDSVIRIINHTPGIIRRSRGYVPQPVDLISNVEGVFAAGAEQKNSFCIGKGSQAFMSQYIGDIKNVATYDFYQETYTLFSSLFRFTPSALVCDMHPEYLSARFAGSLSAETGLPLIKVQHHHAHAVSVMAEHGINEKVIGVCLDGTGYGTDGNIWGSEFMIVSPGDFERYTHFDYFMMPGGDAAVEEPWRMAMSCIFKYMGSDYDFQKLKLFQNVDENKLSVVRDMLVSGLNTPLTSGAGRIFDAVSALLLLCPEKTFDSEAPMRLESAISSGRDDFYPFTIAETVSLSEMFQAIVKELKYADTSRIAARFHNTVAKIILHVCIEIRKETGLNSVVMSGGVFQNKYLLEKSLYLLTVNRFKVYTNNQVPSNDGGVSLGQLMIAAERRGLCA